MSDDAMLMLQAFLIAAAVLGVVIICFYSALIFTNYTAGRKRGGYPIFARFRKRANLQDRAYDYGLKQSRDKIAKGGYK